MQFGKALSNKTLWHAHWCGLRLKICSFLLLAGDRRLRFWANSFLVEMLQLVQHQVIRWSIWEDLYRERTPCATVKRPLRVYITDQESQLVLLLMQKATVDHSPGSTWGVTISVRVCACVQFHDFRSADGDVWVQVTHESHLCHCGKAYWTSSSQGSWGEAQPGMPPCPMWTRVMENIECRWAGAILLWRKDAASAGRTAD